MILDLHWSEGSPDQHSWALLACIDQSKADLYILQIHQKKKKKRGIELQGVTKINTWKNGCDKFQKWVYLERIQKRVVVIPIFLIDWQIYGVRAFCSCCCKLFAQRCSFLSWNSKFSENLMSRNSNKSSYSNFHCQ